MKKNHLAPALHAGLISLSLLFYACDPLSPSSPLDLASSPDSVELFGEGKISTALYERDISIAPNGNEMFYTLGDFRQTRRCLVSLKRTGNRWGKPGILSFSGQYHDIEPFLSPDGHQLFFASNRPIYGDTSRSDYNLWYCNRTENGWSNPTALDSLINTKGNEFYPSLGNSGNLYFTATRPDGVGREDIFIAEYANGKYKTPVVLDSTINTAYYEFNAYISPDENLIVFSSFGRPDGFGGGDLYYSRKNASGTWTPARNFGEAINSDRLDYCPFIDWQHNNLYFTSERFRSLDGPINQPQDLKQYASSPLNGFGNIYRIGLDHLDWE